MHHPEEEWKNGGHCRHSITFDAHLDKSFSASQFARSWMEARGKEVKKTEVLHVGFDATQCFKRDGSLFRRRFGVPFDAKIVVRIGKRLSFLSEIWKIVIARLVESKYPLAVIEIFREILVSGCCCVNWWCFLGLNFAKDASCWLVVVGDGPLAFAMHEAAGKMRNVIFLGPADDEVSMREKWKQFDQFQDKILGSFNCERFFNAH